MTPRCARSRSPSPTGRVILARNRRAVEAGVAVGMTVAEAATHAPDLLLVPDDPRRTQALWDVVLDQMDGLGPVVEDAGLGLALVDLTGAGRSERVLVRRTLHALTTLLGLTARAAVADGPFVAAVAARRTAQELVLVPRDHGAAFLAPLPGRRPAAPRARGRPISPCSASARWPASRGCGSRTYRNAMEVSAWPPSPSPSARTPGRSFPASASGRRRSSIPSNRPVDDLTPILFVIKALLDNHAAILRREGLVAAGLRLTLGIEAREPVVIEQRWGAACVPGAAELDALRLTLGDRFVGEERDGALPPRVTEIAVTLLDCAPDRRHATAALRRGDRPAAGGGRPPPHPAARAARADGGGRGCAGGGASARGTLAVPPLRRGADRHAARTRADRWTQRRSRRSPD